MKILLLAGNTLRARAYAQSLANSNFKNVEVKGLLFGDFNKSISIPELNSETENYFTEHNIFIPNYENSLEQTFEVNNWDFSKIETRDVNSEEVLTEIDRLDCDLVVFAGYGGQLLKSPHFASSRKYLHMHPGKLPLERGSTTIYYSVLNQRKCTVTAFFMTKEIDNGKNIVFKEYEVFAKNVDVDNWFDNLVRADCFVTAISMLLSGKISPETPEGTSDEYYVIHPVLKHCALLSLKEN